MRRMMIFKIFQVPTKQLINFQRINVGFCFKETKFNVMNCLFLEFFDNAKPLSLPRCFHQTLQMSIIIELLRYDYVRHEAALMDIY